VPDCSGCYEAAGLYIGQTFYRRCDGAFSIWFNGFAWSYITAEVGVAGDYQWEVVGPINPPQDFEPTGTAEGIAHVAEP